MYSPLNEDYMFQEMHDRVARIHVHGAEAHRDRHPVATTTGPNRRWWRRVARRTR